MKYIAYIFWLLITPVVIVSTLIIGFLAFYDWWFDIGTEILNSK